MPIAERAAIQFDLNWTNHYSGQADGDFGDRSVAAVKAFQKDRGFRETGVLDRERARGAGDVGEEPARARRLAHGRGPRHRRAGRAADQARATHESQVRSGTRWQSAQGQVQIETFRIREPGATLATVFEDQKKEPPNRQIEIERAARQHLRPHRACRG